MQKKSCYNHQNELFFHVTLFLFVRGALQCHLIESTAAAAAAEKIA
jgi:hypothetical protein